MTVKNKYVNRSKISEKKFRELLRFFALDLDASQIANITGIILQAMVNDDPMAGGGGAGGPGGGGSPPAHKDVEPTFKNMTLNGDIDNIMTTLADVIVKFENATITGAITTGIQTWVGPYPRTIDTLEYIGEVTNTYCDPGNPYGATVSLDADSTWVVDTTSYLTGLTIAPGATITAPKCYSVTMTVDTGTGPIPTPIVAGTYEGNIVLTVTEIA